VELISDLINEVGEARQVDMAARLGVSQPTVAKMLKRLLFANVVFHSLGVAAGNLRTHANRQQKVFHYLMTLAAFMGQIFPYPEITRRMNLPLVQSLARDRFLHLLLLIAVILSRVAAANLRTHANRQQKVFHYLMTLAAFMGQLFPFRG
jgi:uncharacterized membrane protein SirB2